MFSMLLVADHDPPEVLHPGAPARAVPAALLRYEAELAARREPDVLATVVWRRQPAAGKAGAKAVVTTDGKLRG